MRLTANWVSLTFFVNRLHQTQLIQADATDLRQISSCRPQLWTTKHFYCWLNQFDKTSKLQGWASRRPSKFVNVILRVKAKPGKANANASQCYYINSAKTSLFNHCHHHCYQPWGLDIATLAMQCAIFLILHITDSTHCTSARIKNNDN